MSNVICHINLAYEPESEELAVILNNADDFCKKLSWTDIDFDSIKVCINSPESYRFFERGVPFEKAVHIQEDDWYEDEEEDFFDVDGCREDEDEFDSYYEYHRFDNGDWEN